MSDEKKATKPGDDNKAIESLVNANKATQRPCEVQLDQLKMDPKRYCHREDEELSEAALELFLDSLILEGGVRVPVVFYTDSQGIKVVICGNRRVTGCRLLADRNQTGFAFDMPIKAIEVVGASPQDLLVESVSDNENRKNLKPEERLRIVKRLNDAGIEVKRAARALGVSDSTYARDRKLVGYTWAFQHVEDKNIAAGVMGKLIDAADAKQRIKDIREALDAWVAEQKKMINEKAKRWKADKGKEMPETEREVRKFMLPYLVEHWLECIKTDKPLDDNAAWDFRPSIEEGVVRLGGVTLNTHKEPVEKLRKLYMGLFEFISDLEPILKERQDIERGRQEAQRSRQSGLRSYDLAAMRERGLTEVAERLEARQRQRLATPDGEEDSGLNTATERLEADLTTEVELPKASEAGSPSPSESPASVKPPKVPTAPAQAKDDEDKPPILKV